MPLLRAPSLIHLILCNGIIWFDGDYHQVTSHQWCDAGFSFCNFINHFQVAHCPSGQYQHIICWYVGWKCWLQTSANHLSRSWLWYIKEGSKVLSNIYGEVIRLKRVKTKHTVSFKSSLLLLLVSCTHNDCPFPPCPYVYQRICDPSMCTSIN